MKKVKKKSVFASIGYLLLALIVTVAVIETSAMLYGKLTDKQNAVFGYSLNTLEADVAGTDLKKGDGVLIVYAEPDAIAAGDVVAYYADGTLKFGAVSSVEIKAGAYAYTMGTEKLTYADIAGKYIETSALWTNVLRWTIGEYAWACWLGLVALIFLLTLLVKASAYGSKRSMARKVMNGKIGLFEQQCFQKDVYRTFGAKERRTLYKQCRGTELAFDCLTAGKPCKDNADPIAAQVADKRCTMRDALALTYAREPLSQIDGEEYIAALPSVKKKFRGYEKSTDVYCKRRNSRIKIWGIAIGVLLFFGAAIATEFMSGRFSTVSLYEQIGIIAVPSLFLLIAFFHSLGTTGKDKAMERYFACDAEFPQRYEVFVNGAAMTNEQILRALDDIADNLKEFPGEEEPADAGDRPADSVTDPGERGISNVETVEPVTTDPLVELDTQEQEETITEPISAVQEKAPMPRIALAEVSGNDLTRESAKIGEDLLQLRERYDELVVKLLNGQVGKDESGAVAPTGMKFVPADAVVIAEAAATADETVAAFAVKQRLSYAEELETLSEQQKAFYAELKACAMNREKTKLTVSDNGERVKVGSKQFVRFQIKRGILIATFDFETDDIRRLRLAQKGVVKQKPTIVRIIDAAAVQTAKEMMELMAGQLAREAEERKTALRLARKAKKAGAQN